LLKRTALVAGARAGSIIGAETWGSGMVRFGVLVWFSLVTVYFR